ncbi:hypothetical protein JTB14_002913 [Gonioctena quinquepunctata]|nr:hypothetical protein JTB14_002913 [Gonioctena quinquepunctata]
MSQLLQKSNEDLTTDALPSPRSSVDKEGNENVRQDDDENEKVPQVDEEDTHFPNNSSSASSSKTAFRRISQPSGGTPVYQMVNINNSSGVHVGNNYVHHHNGGEITKKTEIIETPAIKSMKLSSDHLTREDMLFVSTHMDSTWKDVAREMKYSEGEISQFICDHQHSGIKEVIFQVFLDWYQNNPTDATVGNLCIILWNNNQKDVVRRWSHKKRSKKQ